MLSTAQKLVFDCIQMYNIYYFGDCACYVVFYYTYYLKQPFSTLFDSTLSCCIDFR